MDQNKITYTKEELSKAENLIAAKHQDCFDVAASCGQIFGNIKHMYWFKCAVAYYRRTGEYLNG